MLLYSEFDNIEDTGKRKNNIPLKYPGDIIKIGGPRPVVNRRGNKAMLLEFIKINENKGGEIWKVEFIKNKELKNHTIFYSPNN